MMNLYPIDKYGNEYYQNGYKTFENKTVFAKNNLGDEIYLNMGGKLDIYPPDNSYAVDRDKNPICALDNGKPYYIFSVDNEPIFPIKRNYFPDKSDYRLDRNIEIYARHAGKQIYPELNGKQYYALDYGSEYMAINENGHTYYAVHNDEEYFALNYKGEFYFIVSTDGSVVYPCNLKTDSVIYKKDSEGNEFYIEYNEKEWYGFNSKHEMRYAKDKNGKEILAIDTTGPYYAERNGKHFYPKDTDLNEYYLNDINFYDVISNFGYAKTNFGREIYPKREDGEYYFQNNLIEICAKDENDNYYYANDKNNNNIYPKKINNKNVSS